MRCGNCRFWGWPGEKEWESGKDCVRLSDWPNFTPNPLAEELKQLPEARAFVAPFAGADGAVFVTKADFGCTHYEEKGP